MMTIKWILLIAVFKYSSGIHPEQTTRTSDSNLRPLSVSTNNCGSNRRCIRFMDCNDLYKENSNLYDSNNDQDADPPCPYFTDVCCTNITTQPIQESLDHKPIKCGVLNPNGVGRKIKEPIDSEAQFGNV